VPSNKITYWGKRTGNEPDRLLHRKTKQPNPIQNPTHSSDPNTR